MHVLAQSVAEGCGQTVDGKLSPRIARSCHTVLSEKSIVLSWAVLKRSVQSTDMEMYQFWLSINSALDQQSRLECSEFTCNGPGDTMYPGQSSE